MIKRKSPEMGRHTLAVAKEAVLRNKNAPEGTRIDSLLHVRGKPGEQVPVGPIDLAGYSPKVIHEIPTAELPVTDLEKALERMESLPPPGFEEVDDETPTEDDPPTETI